MLGSTVNTLPASSARRLPDRRYGSSWISSPMPWPVRLRKWSPWPAASITSRAARSTSSHVTPGRSIASTASYAAHTTAYASSTSPSGSAGKYIRVRSEW